MQVLSTLMNTAEICGSVFAMYKITVNNPFAFGACAMILGHGIISLSSSISEVAEEKELFEVSEGLFELVPLALINMDLYSRLGYDYLAMCHGFFIVPLFLNFVYYKIKDEEEDDGDANALRKLTIMGNIMSLVYLGINEKNQMYLSMAASFYGAKYISQIVEHYFEGYRESSAGFFTTVFAVLTGLALAN